MMCRRPSLSNSEDLKLFGLGEKLRGTGGWMGCCRCVRVSQLLLSCSICPAGRPADRPPGGSTSLHSSARAPFDRGLRPIHLQALPAAAGRRPAGRPDQGHMQTSMVTG